MWPGQGLNWLPNNLEKDTLLQDHQNTINDDNIFYFYFSQLPLQFNAINPPMLGLF